MYKIEKPDFFKMVEQESHEDACNHVEDWFDENITPLNEMLAAGREVWRSDENLFGHVCYSTYYNDYYTHTGLLINVKKIKVETCADLVQELLDVEDKYHARDDWKDRARTALENEK